MQCSTVYSVRSGKHMLDHFKLHCMKVDQPTALDEPLFKAKWLAWFGHTLSYVAPLAIAPAAALAAPSQ